MIMCAMRVMKYLCCETIFYDKYNLLLGSHGFQSPGSIARAKPLQSSTTKVNIRKLGVSSLKHNQRLTAVNRWAKRKKFHIQHLTSLHTNTLVIDKSHLSNYLVPPRQQPRRHHGLISSASGLLPTSSNRTGQVTSWICHLLPQDGLEEKPR
jgi:hypothetical protein